MLEDVVGVDNHDVTFGMRIQGGDLPAIYFTIEKIETLTIGSADILYRADVTIKSVAVNAEDAYDLALDVEAQLNTGTYASVVFSGIINNNSTLDTPESGGGEEQIPATATTLATIIYSL